MPNISMNPNNPFTSAIEQREREKERKRKREREREGGREKFEDLEK